MTTFDNNMEHIYELYWHLYDKACDSARYCFDMRKEEDKRIIEYHLPPDEYETLMRLREIIFPSHKCGMN